MTSLAAQLHNLQTAQTDLYDQQRKPVSVLVPAAEAKQISREAYYKIGCDGFNELQSIPGMHEFNNFFSKDSKKVQRAVLSAEENQKLDKQIDRLFIHLAPHLQRSAALKTLEWLVQRYQVHEMNIDSFICSILPYFETQLFVRLLQIVNLTRSKTWKWLEAIQLAGRPLPRVNLFYQWTSSEWFRNFVANSFLKQMETIPAQSLKHYAVFFIVTVDGGLNSLQKISEFHLTTLRRTMDSCLCSKSLLARGGMCFLLTSLSAMTTLAESFVNRIIEAMCNNLEMNGPLSKEMIACTVRIVHSQEMKSLPDSILALLLNNKLFIGEVLKISKGKNVSTFVKAFMSSAIQFLFSGQISEDEIPIQFNKIVYLLESVNLPADDAKAILKIFVTCTQERMTEFKNLKACPKFGDIFKKLDKCQPACVPRAAASELLSDPIEKEAFLANDTTFTIEVDNVEDEKDINRRKNISDRAEIVSNLNIIENNVFLKATEFHLVREEEYERHFQDIVTIMKKTLYSMQVNPSSENSQILDILFNKILKNSYKQMYFLSMLWSSNSQSLNDLDLSIKEWALLTAKDLIKESKAESVSWMMMINETFILSLFSSLSESKLTALTFTLIENLIAKMGPMNGHNNTKSFMPLLNAILLYKTEIIDDAKFLPSAIETICADNKRHFTLLKNLIADEVVPMRIKRYLLYAVSNIYSFKTLLSFVPVANDILDRMKLYLGELSGNLSMCLYYILIRIPLCKVKKVVKSDVCPLLLRCVSQSERLIKIRGKLYSPQSLVLTEDFVTTASLNDDFFLQILESACFSTNQAGIDPLSSKFREMLCKTSVSGYTIVKLIGNNTSFCNTSTVKQARAKRMKIKNNNDYLDLAPWRKLRFIVEMIGIFKRVKEPWVLVKPLFGYLERSLAELSSGSKNGYAETWHQTLLTTIHLLLRITEKDLKSNEFPQKVKVHFSLLVQLLRTTENPDTRRRVLMILALTTPYFPNEILENVISIFTFMGATLIKMDDNYSIQVMHQAMDAILPPLIKSVQAQPEDYNIKLFQILKLFIVAFPDIAQHRKLPLYVQLSRTIGTEHLWLLMAATAETHVFQLAKCQSKKDHTFHFGRLTSFWDSLFKHFSVMDRLHTIRSFVQFLIDIPEDKDALIHGKLETHVNILKKSSYTTHNLHRLKFTCAQMLIAFLNSSQMIKEMNRITQKEAEFEFSRVYHIILDVTIPYLKKISVTATNSSDTLEADYWSKFEQKMTDLVKVMFELLPPHLLMKVVMNLVWSDDLTVKYRALQIVGEKMEPDSSFFSEEHSEDASDFVKFLISSGKKKRTPDHARQLSMCTLQSVLKAFGHHIEVNLVQSVIQSTVKTLKKKNINADVKLQTVLVAVEGVVILESEAIESLNDIISFILNNLQSTLNQPLMKIEPSLQVLTVCLEKITKVLPIHLGNHISTIINILCRLFHQFEGGNNCSLTESLHYTEQQILHTETNTVLENMKEAYFSLLPEYFDMLPIFFRQLCIIVTEHELEALFANLRSLQKLFSLALQIRTSIKCLDHINEIEESYFKSVSEFLMRCEMEETQANFKFLKKKCSKYAELAVTVTFYKFCSYLSSSLRVVFISFRLAEEIFDDAISILSSNNSSSSEEIFTDDNCLLVDAVLDTIYNTFVHDSIGYMNRGRLTTCITPIIDQIDNVMGGSELYKNRISNHLRPCIAKMASVCRDDDFWRDITQAILSRIKNEWSGENLIILGTLEVFEGIVDEIGIEFVQSQINDIMVYIAEAIEIIDPEIQSKTKQIFLKLEETLGESLKSYLGS